MRGLPVRPLLLLAVLTLSGCSALAALDRAATPLDVYELRAPAAAPVARAQRNTQLVVEVPTASGAIETDRILIRPTPSRIAYLPDAAWSAPAPVMLQSAMVETFLRADAFRFVGRRPISSTGDVALLGELLDFGARVVPGTAGAEVEMTLVARLVRESDARIVASRTFTRTVAVPDTDTPTLLAGFESVSDAVLTDLAGWVFGALGVATR